jgi:hypothetical protein
MRSGRHFGKRATPAAELRHLLGRPQCPLCGKRSTAHAGWARRPQWWTPTPISDVKARFRCGCGHRWDQVAYSRDHTSTELAAILNEGTL